MAEEGFAAADMKLYAAAARRQRGQLLGGTEGRALVGAADAWMTGQDIREPARIAALLAPGFEEPTRDSHGARHARNRGP